MMTEQQTSGRMRVGMIKCSMRALGEAGEGTGEEGGAEVLGQGGEEVEEGEEEEMTEMIVWMAREEGEVVEEPGTDSE